MSSNVMERARIEDAWRRRNRAVAYMKNHRKPTTSETKGAQNGSITYYNIL